MKKKFALATVTAVTTLLFFVGCGVRVTGEKWGRFLN